MIREQANKESSIVNDIKTTEALLSLLSNKGFLKLTEENTAMTSLKLECKIYHISVHVSNRFLLEFKEFLIKYNKELEIELEKL